MTKAATKSGTSTTSTTSTTGTTSSNAPGSTAGSGTSTGTAGSGTSTGTEGSGTSTGTAGSGTSTGTEGNSTEGSGTSTGTEGNGTEGTGTEGSGTEGSGTSNGTEGTGTEGTGTEGNTTEPCKHEGDKVLHVAVPECTDGYKSDVYECKKCGEPFTKDGGPTEPVKGVGHKIDLTKPTYEACEPTCTDFGWKENIYKCEYCRAFFTKDLDRAITAYLEKKDHVFGDTPVEFGKNNYECVGGYAQNIYLCTVCNGEFAADGTPKEHVQYVDPDNAHHTPYLDRKYEADWVPCRGGFTEPYYYCSICKSPCTASGGRPQYKLGDGKHEAGAKIEDADPYTPCNGGIKVDVFACKHCGSWCTIDGSPEIPYSPPESPHDLNPNVKRAADYTPCGGGHTEDSYQCRSCGDFYTSDQRYPNHLGGNGSHKLGKKVADAGITPCRGGFMVDVYECEYCKKIFTQDGRDGWSVWLEGTGKHSSSGELVEDAPKYTPCNGGYKKPVYTCKDCGDWCFADGSWAERVRGNGKHTAGEKIEDSYTECLGGFPVKAFYCKDCGSPCDENGYLVLAEPGTGVHKPGEPVPDTLKYTPCYGGYKDGTFICQDCGAYCDKDGKPVDWTEPTGHTIPSELTQKADYTKCNGGYKEDVYECTVCGKMVTKDGKIAEYFEGDGKHTVGRLLSRANFTECGGGYKEDVYECSVCKSEITSSGKPAEGAWGNGEHKPSEVIYEAEKEKAPCQLCITGKHRVCTVCGKPLDPVTGKYASDMVQAPKDHDMEFHKRVDPTTEAEGRESYYSCKMCKGIFADKNGWWEISMESLVIPKLKKESKPVVVAQPKVNIVKSDELEELEELKKLPETIVEKYETVEKLEKAIREVVLAETAEKKVFKESAELQCLLLNNTLEIQEASGKKTPVTIGNFPAKGLKVVLPYPEKTTQKDFVFAVAQVHTYGEHVGEVEVLKSTLTKDGIEVTLKTLSPVAIYYQAK